MFNAFREVFDCLIPFTVTKQSLGLTTFQHGVTQYGYGFDKPLTTNFNNFGFMSKLFHGSWAMCHLCLACSQAMSFHWLCKNRHHVAI